MSYDVGHRHSSDLAWLWLWCRPAVVVLIRPLAWEPPYAMVQPKKDKRPKKKKKKKKMSSVTKSVTLRIHAGQWPATPSLPGRAPELEVWVMGQGWEARGPSLCSQRLCWESYSGAPISPPTAQVEGPEETPADSGRAWPGESPQASPSHPASGSNTHRDSTRG